MRRTAPTDVWKALPPDAVALTRAVVEAADAADAAVYLVGGPVRDLLMGRELRDVDLMVEDAAAPELAERVGRAGIQVTVHERFRTATLRDQKAVVDLTTARRESYVHDGALPRVEPGSLEDDLRRRDFSVNALALPLSAPAHARHKGVVDVGAGLEDLANRRLRIFHPRSFHDDPTRALRAARLAPRLGFTLTRDSRSALRAALRDGAFGRVSGERLRRELVKLFEDAALGLDPARALRLLHDWHVLGVLEPGLVLERAAALSLRRLGRDVAAPAWPPQRWRPWLSGLALWLAPLTPALRRRALRRFAVRGEQATHIVEFPRRRDQWLRALERARGRGRVDAVLIGSDEESLRALHASASTALRRRIARWAAEDRGRRLPLTGADLVELGLGGPAVGRALQRIRTAVLDGTVRSRDEALALARELSHRARTRKAVRPR